MSGKFGWSLPPGVSYADIDPKEGPCDVCGLSVDECICPECPVCGGVGDPKCYETHELVRTPKQISGRAALEDLWRREREAEEEQEWQERMEQLRYEEELKKGGE